MANFDEIIDGLADALQADLYPNVDGVVSMIIKGTIKAQIDLDRRDDGILVCLYIAELPPGKFREHVLKDALKANSRLLTNRGVLAYIGKHNSLVLFQKVRPENITTDSLIDILKHLTARTKLWQDAIDSGHASPDEEMPKVGGTHKNSMFGM
ncbi:CesT family type III secretion system chaperone [bacterium]|nr:CesT family type III secretion system chaperone [bacterium]